MATSLDIYNRLFAGETLRIAVSKAQYDVLRQQLSNYHKVTRHLLTLSSDVLYSAFAAGTGTFRIGAKKESAILSVETTS